MSAHTPLVWGQRVVVCDERLACFGRVGTYEGYICSESDALRVHFSGGRLSWSGVLALARFQLLPTTEHPVCIARRLKLAGHRPPRVKFIWPDPPCYTKDYGKTSLELAVDAFVEGRGSAEEMLRLQVAEFRRQWVRDAQPRRLKPTTKATGSAS